MSRLLQDLRLAFRVLLRTPVTTSVALLTLALGIGATTAIFSVVRGVLLTPLALPEPDEIVIFGETTQEGQQVGLSYDNFRFYQENATRLESVAVARSQSVGVTGGGLHPDRIRGLFVSASFFEVLGQEPAGRALAAGEDEPGGPRTAVLSHGFWQRRYGGDDVIGETILLNNEPHTIVGVMPADFRLPIDTTEAWISLQTYPGGMGPRDRSLFGLGRLADDASLDEARSELALLADRQHASDPEVNPGETVDIARFSDYIVGDATSRLMTLLFVGVLMVLLIACANIANLQLSRATGRQREMAVRTALGGSRLRLLRQLLTENVVLALVAGVLGLAVGKGGLALLLAVEPLRLHGRYDVAMNTTVFVFAALVALVSGVLFGLVPAWRTSKANLIDGLREHGRGLSGGSGSGRLRQSLVVAQTALALVLLVAALLLFQSLANLNQIELGFDPDNLLTVQFRLPGNKYTSDEQIVRFFDQMLENVAAVPGVEGVVSALGLPFTGDEGTVAFLADGVDPGAEVQVPEVWRNIVSPNYFAGMGIPLLSGRGFEEQDRQRSSSVAVVSQSVADQFWAAEGAVGQTFKSRGSDTLFTIIGVVGDVNNRGLRDGDEPMLYLPYAQAPARFATIGVRVPGDPLGYTNAVRDAVWELDPDQPLWEIMTQNQRIDEWTGRERSASSLMAIFGALALLLAAIGIGGVIAYSVGRRTREIGIRRALGAQSRQILGMVLSEGGFLLSLGLGLGAVGAVFASRALSGLLYGIEPVDVASYILAAALLAAVALLACYLPARRATAIDPGLTLRDE